MQVTFYCGACGKNKPLSEKVERSGKRATCQSCERKARALSAKAGTASGGLKRRAPTMNAAFLNWAAHV